MNLEALSAFKANSNKKHILLLRIKNPALLTVYQCRKVSYLCLTMERKANYLEKSDIFFSCTEKEYLVKEHFVPEHVITHIYSGKLLVTETDKNYTIEEGDTVMFGKNHLAKVTKVPGENGPFKSISIFFTQAFLQGYYAEHTAVERNPIAYKFKKLEPHLLLESLFNSILPYYEMPDNLPEELTEMKLREAVSILRKIDKTAEAILSDFNSPGKIDLSGFMHKNFSFNISNEQFAYLTGRSLATFKRDFQKAFGTSPQKWLLKQRLELAHFMIFERKKKPSDVYLEVGFENLSHFSYSFKRFFGYNASSQLLDA